jgi:PKD repeat protein
VFPTPGVSTALVTPLKTESAGSAQRESTKHRKVATMSQTRSASRAGAAIVLLSLFVMSPALSSDANDEVEQRATLSSRLLPAAPSPSLRSALAPRPLGTLEHILDGGFEGGPGPISWGKQGVSGSGDWSWTNMSIAAGGGLTLMDDLNPIWQNQGGTNAHSGLYMVYFNPFGASATEVSQYYSINTGDKATLSFWLRVGAGASTSTSDSFGVFLTDPSAPTWTVVGVIDVFDSSSHFHGNNGYWTQYSYDVSQFSGKTLDIHFRSYVVSTCIFQLDDVSLVSTSTPPPSPSVTADFTYSPNPAVAGLPVHFSDASSGSPTSWSWTFGDGTSSVQQSPSHTYATEGTYTVFLTAANGTSRSTRAQSVAVSKGVSSSTTKVLPIILDVDNGTTRFTTEVTLANRGSSPATLSLAFTAATALSSSGSGTVSETIAPGRQLVIPDAIGYLRLKGLPIPTGSNQGGTLRVTFNGISSPDAAFAGARTTAPSGSGRAGLAYPAVRLDEGMMGRSWVYGLRQTSTDRTNLALVNMDTAGPITLRVTLQSGTDGATTVLPDVILGPGQWTQIGRVLDSGGLVNGYARIDFISGAGPYYAYAVFNDSVTNDGSYVAPVASPSPAETMVLPALVETPVFQSELILTNPSSRAATANLTYLESLTPGSGAGGSTTVTLLAYEQKIIPNAVDYLRTRGVAVGPRGAASYAGSLVASFATDLGPSYGFLGARISAPGDGGQYGLFYRALGISEAASADAYVFGLQQNSSARSNLAVTNAGDAGSVSFQVDIYNGDTGTLAGSSNPMTLLPGGWLQLSSILSPYTVSNAYARVTRQGGTSRIVAYGVVNDGATPSSGATNDGSYVQFSNR